LYAALWIVGGVVIGVGYISMNSLTDHNVGYFGLIS